ncbi:putative alcohol dehydrogenase protein [Botrytis fragariae]|uniref:Putative alcohol dehydrogenase protein n=1 Tax=Botrytis fragariae TaxID=1964551 RepID=A0A8H6AID5_9HELO|nr:putative alcohol dehydrogenase protein [Botrytis fragariae]KAF5867793.1 putative alcohol dehydrogenase protein [Botrytis fragariae]
MSSTKNSLPTTMRALYAEAQGQPLTVKTIPTPQPGPGSLIVKVLAVSIEPSIQRLVDGKMPYLYTPTPYVPGGRAVGRVAAIGPDTTTLSIGQLVTIEPFVRGRDNSDVKILWGLGSFGRDPKAKKLIEVWRDGSLAEYAKIPLENVFVLNEKRLLGSPAEGGLGYSLGDLSSLAPHMVPYGGFRGIDLKAGETVIVSPATGLFSSAAVEVALAMGARVIAVSRNLSKLQKLAAANQRVEIVQTTGNYEEDLARIKALGPVDAYLDLSPQEANGSSYIRACLMSLRDYGRASLMGVTDNDIDIPYKMAVMKKLTIRGQYMYEREDAKGLIKLVESGLLKLGKAGGKEVVGEFSIEQWDEGIKSLIQNPEPEKMAIMYL